MLRRLKKLLKRNVVLLLITCAATVYIMTAVKVISPNPFTASKKLPNNPPKEEPLIVGRVYKSNAIRNEIQNEIQNVYDAPEDKRKPLASNPVQTKHFNTINDEVPKSHDAPIPKESFEIKKVPVPKEQKHNDKAYHAEINDVQKQNSHNVPIPAEPIKIPALSKPKKNQTKHQQNSKGYCSKRMSYTCRLTMKLINELAQKLTDVDAEERTEKPMDLYDFEKTCSHYNYKNYANDRFGKYINSGTLDKNLRSTIPSDIEERVSSLLALPTIPERHVWSTMTRMRDKIDGVYDVIILSAVTDRQYLTALDMFQHLQKDIFPILDNVNYKFILYDLGLSETHREAVEAKCRCILLKIPPGLPHHYQDQYYCNSAWRTFFIATHFEQTEITIWMDISIRFSDPTAIQTLMQRTMFKGIQQRRTKLLNNRHTHPSMFEFYGDSPCSHGNHIHQSDTSFGMYHNEPLIWHAVMLPWLSCASRASCICPRPFKDDDRDGCNDTADLSDLDNLGACHRKDQSAMSIILAHLFRDLYNEVSVDMDKFLYAVDKDESWIVFPSWDLFDDLDNPYLYKYLFVCTLFLMVCFFRCGYMLEKTRLELKERERERKIER